MAGVVAGALPAALGSVGTLLTGIGVLTTSVGGLAWFPVAVAAGLLGGLFNAWVLLVEIMR